MTRKFLFFEYLDFKFYFFRSRLHFCCFDALTWISWNNGPTCNCHHLAFYKVNIIVSIFFAFKKKVSYVDTHVATQTFLNGSKKVIFLCLQTLMRQNKPAYRFIFEKIKRFTVTKTCYGSFLSDLKPKHYYKNPP